MNKKEKGNSGLSRSFVTGVIALVFLILGYQTALFIHRAAVLKIAADRDNADTVYVYMGPDAMETGQSKPVKSVRKDAKHSPYVEAVRQNMPNTEEEPFRFNPNTATVEELCRLGFTQKQAQAIDNYRKKGGRFNRKTDFAESFVVSEEAYKRLEGYIDIPLLDLNIADSAAFDALPGIGGWYATKIIEYRNRLGGYSFKEQLLEIYRFDQQKYDGLKDLITIGTPHTYPLWELPADSLCRHPYIQSYETARAIVMFREHNPQQSWTVENLCTSGIISPDIAYRLSRCVVEVIIK